MRTRQTVDCVAMARGLEVTLMEEFCERDYGVFEGLKREDIEAQYPIVRAPGTSPPS
jgi:broad specificity phosphatase PhoE